MVGGTFSLFATLTENKKLSFVLHGLKFNEIRGEREHSFGDMKNNFPSCFMVSVL